MNETIGVAPVMKMPKFTARLQFGRLLSGSSALVSPLAAMVAVLAISPADAACLQSGSTVTCSGASATGFGTGVENNLTVTVQSGGSITTANAINLGDSNAVTNNGAIVVTGGDGIQGRNYNALTNAGTMTLGDYSVGMYVSGSINVLTNSGAIIGSGTGSYGIMGLGAGNTVTNSGSIILTGSNTLGISDVGGGATIVNSGTIKADGGVALANGSTLTNSGAITAVAAYSASVVLSSGDTVINDGRIGASGSIGAGIFINGASSTIVNNGTIAGGVAGHSLRSFSSNGNSITNNGTLDGQISLLGTGNSLVNAGLITITDPGTALPSGGNLSIGGTFTQTTQGTLALRVDNAGFHDGLYATDQVALNGGLRAVLRPGLYGASTTFTDVVESGTSVTGQFASVTSSSVFFNAAASYNIGWVDLTLTRYGFGSVAGETANQRSIGAALESGYSTALTGSAAAFYTQLLQAGSLRVLDRLSGEGSSGTQNAAFTTGALFGQTMDGQMEAWRAGNRGGGNGMALDYAEEAPNGITSAFNAVKAPSLAQPQWNAWGAGFGAGQQLSGNAGVGSASFNDRAAGGAIGVDHLVNPDLLIGISAGGSSATFSVDDRATSGRLEGGHIGGYAMQRFGASYLSAEITYSHFNNNTTRTISGVGPDETAKGSFASDQLGGRLEIGRTFDYSRVSVTPFAAIQAARLWQDAYTETSTAGTASGILGLSYAAHAVSSLPVFIGAKFDGRFDFGNGMLWSPFVNAAWVHEFETSRTVTATLTTVAMPAFTVEGARAASDAARVDLGSRLVLDRAWELSARVTGEFSALGQSYAGMGALRANW